MSRGDLDEIRAYKKYIVSGIAAKQYPTDWEMKLNNPQTVFAVVSVLDSYDEKWPLRVRLLIECGSKTFKAFPPFNQSHGFMLSFVA